MPVMKNDGRVRICGDYKITVNREVKLDKYPIPQIEELFASLDGGKAFTKLDLHPDPSGGEVTAICRHKHAQGPFQVQETAIWGGICTLYFSEGNGEPASGHQWGMCVY